MLVTPYGLAKDAWDFGKQVVNGHYMAATGVALVALVSVIPGVRWFRRSKSVDDMPGNGGGNRSETPGDNDGLRVEENSGRVEESVVPNKINMRSADDLMGVESASPELISAVSKKRDVVIAQPGSEELRMLDYFGAEASVGGANNTHILLRENPSKAALLEEFLHGTQSKLGITDRLGTSGLGSSETHVKDFMIRHQKMLGLGDEDVQILQILRDKGL